MRAEIIRLYECAGPPRSYFDSGLAVDELLRRSIDRERRTFGTRLTMLAVKPSDRLPVGLILEQLNGLWPESRALVLMAPLDAQLDDSLLDWQPPPNAVVEIPAIALRDPSTQGLVQRARRAGIKMALRGRPDVPLPPALLDCFSYALIHITEDRRRRSDGSNAPPPPGVMRRMPFIITGAFRVDDLQAAYSARRGRQCWRALRRSASDDRASAATESASGA